MENKIKNSEAYLNSFLEKKTGFSVPKNYFDHTDERFSSFLIEDKFSKNNAYSTPGAYFKNLEDIIVSKVIDDKKPTRVISLKQRIYKALPIGIAAAIALLISVTYFNIDTTEENLTFDNLAQNDIESWLIENSEELSTQDIAAIIPMDNITDSDFTFATINDTEIENYIIYNDNTNILNEIN
ncbi:MAG: hypothetical protein AB8B78_14490 [Polaribacter sp.]